MLTGQANQTVAARDPVVWGELICLIDDLLGKLLIVKWRAYLRCSLWMICILARNAGILEVPVPPLRILDLYLHFLHFHSDRHNVFLVIPPLLLLLLLLFLIFLFLLLHFFLLLPFKVDGPWLLIFDENFCGMQDVTPGAGVHVRPLQVEVLTS